MWHTRQLCILTLHGYKVTLCPLYCTKSPHVTCKTTLVFPLCIHVGWLWGVYMRAISPNDDHLHFGHGRGNIWPPTKSHHIHVRQLWHSHLAWMWHDLWSPGPQSVPSTTQSHLVWYVRQLWHSHLMWMQGDLWSPGLQNVPSITQVNLHDMWDNFAMRWTWGDLWSSGLWSVPSTTQSHLTQHARQLCILTLYGCKVTLCPLHCTKLPHATCETTLAFSPCILPSMQK